MLGGLLSMIAPQLAQMGMGGGGGGLLAQVAGGAGGLQGSSIFGGSSGGGLAGAFSGGGGLQGASIFGGAPTAVATTAAANPEEAVPQGLFDRIKGQLPDVAKAMGPQILAQNEDRRQRLRDMIASSPGVQQFGGGSPSGFKPTPIQFRGLLGGFNG